MPATGVKETVQAALARSYTITRELGGGGMSRVFLAEDLTLGRTVVIKVLASSLSGVVSAERFEREIRLVARLQHPHIVPLFSSGVADGILYYTMPFIEGESLRAKLDREGSLTAATTTRI